MLNGKEYKQNAKLRKVAFVRIEIDRRPCGGLGSESVCNATEEDARELYEFFEAWAKRFGVNSNHKVISSQRISAYS